MEMHLAGNFLNVDKYNFNLCALRGLRALINRKEIIWAQRR